MSNWARVDLGLHNIYAYLKDTGTPVQIHAKGMRARCELAFHPRGEDRVLSY